MPRLYVYLICLISFLYLQSWQAHRKVVSPKRNSNKAEQIRKSEITLPDFPARCEAFKQYFLKNISYPDDARQNDIQGIVLVRFLVDVDGSISKIKVLRDIGGGCGEEVIRVINSASQWKLHSTAGKTFPTVFMLKIQFTIMKYY